MDPAIVKYANRLEQKIVSGQTYVTITWLKVVDDREFNTFSLPGGFLSFSVGLIPDSENEVQQTAALAHETAHVTACQMTRVEMRSKIDRRRAFAARPLRSVTRRLFGPLLLAELVRNAEFDADQLVGGAPSEYLRTGAARRISYTPFGSTPAGENEDPGNRNHQLPQGASDYICGHK